MLKVGIALIVLLAMVSLMVGAMRSATGPPGTHVFAQAISLPSQAALTQDLMALGEPGSTPRATAAISHFDMSVTSPATTTTNTIRQGGFRLRCTRAEMYA
jgi:hypothetical protein